MGMQMGDLVAAGLVGFMFYKMAGGDAVKNSGMLQAEPEGVPPSDEQPVMYADAGGIKGREPQDGCTVPPPQSISTSLLPASNEPMSEDDFAIITPEGMNNVNFLQAGWSIGRDTKAATMRNASWDLRSEPAVPRTLNIENNAFLNSTIDGNPPRKIFEIESASE